MEGLLEKAIKNNAEWCNAVCKSHNAAGLFLEDVWINKNIVPRFYPNVITLKPHIDNISEYLQEISLSSFTLKDSYNNIEIDTQEYSILFEAEWIAYTTLALKPTENWKILKSPDELEAWELSWNNNIPDERIFLPVLLDNPDIFFLAKYEENQIIAGAIANISSEVIALSNVFGTDKSNNIYSETSFFIRNYISQHPIVGYENEENLEQTKTAGFSSIGKLKVIQIS